MSRLRAKTSGLGEFFRGTARPDDSLSVSPPMANALEPPSDSPTRKKPSKLPFLGRTRKKSFLPDAHPAAESDHEENKVKAGDEHASLGAKLVSHFTPTKSRRPSPRRSSRSLATGSLLSPMPATTRTSSVDTGSTRATTPRPTITVSEDLSEYEDLFTRPNRKSVVSIATAESSDPPPSPKISFPSLDEDAKTSSSRFVDDTDRTLVQQEKRRSFPAIPFKSRSAPQQYKSLPSLLPLPSNPPTEPLPPPPLPAAQQPSFSRKSSDRVPRQRAQTLASLSPTPPLTPLTPSLPSDRIPAPLENNTIDELDIDMASVEQLRLALRAKIRAFDELTAHLNKIVETHAAEKSLFEQKLAALEKDARRKDKEIKGLTWLVANSRPGSSGNAPGAGNIAGNLSDSASRSLTSLLDTRNDQSNPAVLTTVRLPQYRRLVAAEDSGAESSQLSGAESPYSGNESSSSFPGKRVKRQRLLDPKGFPSRSLSMKQIGARTDLTVPNVPKMANNAKRSSLSSLASTNSTSSSLLSPSPTPTVLPHLTVIPESSPTPTPRSTPTPSSLRSTRDPAILAAIQAAEQLREKEERRSRTTKRIFPSQTPAAAYAANLKRGLPPSIDQVLNQSSAEQRDASSVP